MYDCFCTHTHTPRSPAREWGNRAGCGVAGVLGWQPGLRSPGPEGRTLIGFCATACGGAGAMVHRPRCPSPSPTIPPPQPRSDWCTPATPKKSPSQLAWVCLSHQILSIQGGQCPIHPSSPRTRAQHTPGNHHPKAGSAAPSPHLGCPTPAERQGGSPHPNWVSQPL